MALRFLLSILIDREMKTKIYLKPFILLVRSMMIYDFDYLLDSIITFQILLKNFIGAQQRTKKNSRMIQLDDCMSCQTVVRFFLFVFSS